MFYERPVIWLHVLSDAAIAAAYYSIPLGLVSFVRQRRDVAFSWIFWMFAAFILACGTTHLVGLIDIWKPFYKVDGVIKLITAVLSIGTAVVLWPLIPKLVALPSPAMLEATVRQRSPAVKIAFHGSVATRRVMSTGLKSGLTDGSPPDCARPPRSGMGARL